MEKYSSYKIALINVMKEIRKPMYTLNPNTGIAYLYFERTVLPPTDSNECEKNYMMPFLILVTNPCSHLLRNGGCTMCGYSRLASFKRNIGRKTVYNQFKRGLEIIKRIPNHQMVAIGTAGSFLDPNEVPYDVQTKILKELNDVSDIYYINIESRTEYINEESLRRLVEAVEDPSKLSIGIGLESSNDLIRELCINKCLSIKLFIRSLKLLKKYNISSTVYVTIGKPFIDDWTNIVDTVESIKFAFQYGADRVVLLRIGIQPYTLLYWLYKHGLYKPIEVWAIVEVLKRLPPELRKNVFIANPKLPQSLEIEECPCSQTAIELLDEYKGTLDYSYIEAIDMLSCSHKEKWYENLFKEMDSKKEISTQISESYRQWLTLWRNLYET